MELYIYNKQNKTVVSKIEKVSSYTDNKIVTEDGFVYTPLADFVELSSTADCSETLRQDWKNSQEPSSEEVLLEIAADHEERLCMMELGI